MNIESPGSNKIKTPRANVRQFIPYGRQWIAEEDIEAVVKVLRSDWLTTGPKVREFENEFARFTGAKEAVAVSSGTAALHCIMHAIGINAGDEVIVSPITFVATANAIVFQGGKPVFADIDPETLLIDPKEVEARITPRTKAIIAVDYAGQPCNYDALQTIANRYGITLIADSCHALGARYREKNVGTLADLTAFSFHPVKHITTGEGGMVTTNNTEWAAKIRRFRSHGINSDHRQRTERGTWYYEMVELGYNYRMTDIQCALGLSQLRKLPKWIIRRRQIAEHYNKAFSGIPGIIPLKVNPEVFHAYHLYVLNYNPDSANSNRGDLFAKLHEEGIGANVHYIPVHLHAYYQQCFGYQKGNYPKAEDAYERIISLPIYPGMADRDVSTVIDAITVFVLDHVR